MRKIHFQFLLLALFFTPIVFAQQNTWQYYFDEPATIWEQSIPLGNGRIGMMPYGGIDEDRIVLNENSLWAGQKQNADNPQAYLNLQEIRSLLFQRKNKEAEELMYKTFTCLGEGSEDIMNFGNFQNFGNLYITSIYSSKDSLISNYRRELDMNHAISRTSYTRDSINYLREYFTSFTDDVGIIRYSANKAKSISLSIALQRDENCWLQTKGNSLIIGGQMPSANPNGGITYYGKVEIKNIGGSLSVENNQVIVKEADEVVFLVSMATNYNNPSALTKTEELLKETSTKEYATLKSSHIEAYAKLFDRVDITLPSNKNSDLPINKRLEAFVEDRTDYHLSALYMQYGRYLLISSTRVGGLPPNLQGLWAHQVMTPWNGDYHLNINLQMNYWNSEVGNLSELHTTLIDYVKTLVSAGEKTAKVYYNSEGWVTHILGNVWQFTSPSENPSWGATNTANAWLCQHLWQHYEFTQDKEYLKSVYPIMRGASLFFRDMLVEHPTTKYLVTSPTTSPENRYVLGSDTLSIVAGSTMDNQLVRELFTNTIAAASILNKDSVLSQQLNSKLKRIAPTSIGQHEQIMEWLEDYEEADPQHRHVSQLYGLHPGNEMTYEKTPQLMKAARKTLERRGDQSTGWSMAWKINFWTRLKDSDRAYKLIGDILTPAKDSWGTYPNLFSAHPPMQIDGNFGGSAGIMEMLVQSHSGYIEFLPAIPKQWTEGKVRGFKVRGGAEVSFCWEDGKIKKVEIDSSKIKHLLIKSNHKPSSIKGVEKYSYKNKMLELSFENLNQKVEIYY